MTAIIRRNNVRVIGNGAQVLLFAHGFGCDQNAWKYIVPYFGADYTLVLFDYVGAGESDTTQYDAKRYNSLEGYATDLIEICTALDLQDTIFIGHSVSCMIGALASIRKPTLFKKLVLIGPSPCYINKTGYTGGFDAETIDSLMEVMEEDYIAWARSMAPAIMDAENGTELGKELADSFCYIDPVIAKQFARVTFLSDNRADVPDIPVHSLTIINKEDMISPMVVGEYIHAHAPGNVLIWIEGRGHCPHMSHPKQTAEAILAYIDISL
jgi:sigma-B regulation protein RsbQ